MPLADKVDIWALSDLATPWCVHVVVTLRIADRIHAGITRIEKLAVASDADRDSLHRVLKHLVSKGVFEEPSRGEFALNEPARMLLDPGMHLGLNLDGFGGRMALAWGSLLNAVRTGTPAYHEIFGHPFWEDLQAHPNIQADFDALMGPAGHGTPDPEVLITGGWESVHTVVDVGGGTGALLAEILRAHPALRGTLVDLPRTVARSGEIFAAAGVADRVTAVGQSFFEPLPAGADLYVLKNVLADWPDDKAMYLLKRCAEAARPAGHIAIVGGISPDENPSPELLMMVLVGGRSRNIEEFRGMARQAGLEVEGTGRQPSGRFVVQCRAIRN